MTPLETIKPHLDPPLQAAFGTLPPLPPGSLLALQMDALRSKLDMPSDTPPQDPAAGQGRHTA